MATQSSGFDIGTGWNDFWNGGPASTANTQMVQGLYAPAQQNLINQIGAQKNEAAGQTRQQNLLQGTQGPAGTSLINTATRRVGEAGNQQLLGLGQENRKALYNAAQQDLAATQAQGAARRAAIFGAIQTGAGLIGGLPGLAAKVFTPKTDNNEVIPINSDRVTGADAGMPPLPPDMQ